MSRPVFYVYILSSLSGTFYAGLTDNLPVRIAQHKAGKYDGFTKKYEVNRLLYYEGYDDSHSAREREKQVKKLSRAKKVALIESMNPEWKDLSSDLYSLRIGKVLKAAASREQGSLATLGTFLYDGHNS